MAARRLGSLLLPGPAGDRLDPNNTFDWIMDQSEKNGLQSEFYFMAGKTSPYDSGYDVFSPRIQRLLTRIHERGHIIGLHPSYGTLGRIDLLKAEVTNLRRAMDLAGANQELKNGRQHYLRWWVKRTWTDWQEAGLKADSSVGFADHAGFRAGTSKPYAGWSFAAKSGVLVIEYPLVLMDGTLFSKKYMKLKKDESIILLNRLSLEIKKNGDHFVTLWHNDIFLNCTTRNLLQLMLTEDW
jgi:hypothetical protein